MIEDSWLKWLRWNMPYVIAVRLSRLSVAELHKAESSLLGQVKALGDAVLIRWHGKQFSSLALWIIFEFLGKLSSSFVPRYGYIGKSLKNPSRCIARWCALILYTMSLWLCTKLYTNKEQQTPLRKLMLPRSKTEYVPCRSIYIIMQPMPYMALSTLFLIWYQSALRSANW